MHETVMVYEEYRARVFEDRVCRRIVSTPEIVTNDVAERCIMSIRIICKRDLI
jgi:hypothetical protein